MTCKAHCICQCQHVGCACWDGIAIVKLDREIKKDEAV